MAADHVELPSYAPPMLTTYGNVDLDMGTACQSAVVFRTRKAVPAPIRPTLGKDMEIAYLAVLLPMFQNGVGNTTHQHYIVNTHSRLVRRVGQP